LIGDFDSKLRDFALTMKKIRCRHNL
jgi:hypothetical protein